MKKETFLSNAEIHALFGNIQEIVQFQRVFLQSLEEAIAPEPEFYKFETPSQFKVSVWSEMRGEMHVKWHKFQVQTHLACRNIKNDK